MERAQIEDRAKGLIVSHLGCSPEEVTNEVRFVPEVDVLGRVKKDGAANLECDSLDIVELTMAFEDEFRVEIADEESEKLNDATFKDAVDLIESKLGE